MYASYVAIGDSFTEGVGDELPDGRVRGWADLVASGLAAAANEPVLYANLAIRGRKLGPIVGEQLDAAIAMKPQLLSLNGGGNDIMRPRVSMDEVVSQTADAVAAGVQAGIHVLLLSGANPSDNLPGGRTIQRRGGELADRVRAIVPSTGVTFVDNFADPVLRDLRFWSLDRLHLNAFGHAHVASNVLRALQVPVPAEWRVDEIAAQAPMGRKAPSLAYYRQYVLPWIGRRLTGRSSGDGRAPKSAELTPVDPDIVV